MPDLALADRPNAPIGDAPSNPAAALPTIPLSHLTIDRMNTRLTARGVDPVLLASIAAVGVLMPFRVRLAHDDADLPRGRFLVIDGGRRLLACRALVEQGLWDADQPVPYVLGTQDDARAREESLVLNIVRQGLHPVDEYRAFLGLWSDKSRPLDVDAISRRFHLTSRQVEQRLALGRLDDAVLDLWRDGRITADSAQLLTLADKKTQAKIVDRLGKQGRIQEWAVRDQLKLGHNNPGQMLDIVGEEAYTAAGGKVTRDLFGRNHLVSDEKLLQKLVLRRIEEECERLVSAGWAWALPTGQVKDRWNYGRIDPAKAKPTPEEQARLDALNAQVDADENAEEEDEARTAAANAARDEAERIEEQIAGRAYTKEQMARAGCVVEVENGALQVSYGLVKPEEKHKAAAQERAAQGRAGRKAGGSKAGGKAEPRKGDDRVSNALVQRLSEQLTQAAAQAIVKQPKLALAAILAGFAAGHKPVSVSERGLAAKKGAARRTAAFDSSFEQLRALPQDELLAKLAQVCAQALDFQTFNSESPPMKDKGVAALVNAIDDRAMNKAIAEAFDAKDYFGGVAKGVIVGAVREAMGEDHAQRVERMKSAEAAKFGQENLPGRGWLPPQLRTLHYDGPGIRHADAGKTGAPPAAGKPAAKAKPPAAKAKPAQKAKAPKVKTKKPTVKTKRRGA